MKTIEWDLPSGKWQSSPSGERNSFARTDLPHHMGSLSPEQLRGLGLRDAFPPEFRFDPTTGHELPAAETVVPWTTPDGGHAINPNYIGFGIDAVTEFTGLDPAEPATIPSPGNGQFEFAVGGFNTTSEQLLAVNVKDYVLKLWLVDAWVDLHCRSDLVPEGYSGATGWRAELFESPNEPSRLYVPTHDGLVMLAVDASTLTYECFQVASPDCQRVCGPPMAWLGGLLFPYVDTVGHVAVGHVVDERNPLGIKRLPSLSDNSQSVDARLWFRCAASRKDRLAVWVSQDRVLQLNRAWAGIYLQSMPEGHCPAFESVRPFIDANESFWFLVSSAEENRYILLGQRTDHFDTRVSDRVYACAGQRFFRKDLLFESNDPWSESNQDKDSFSTTHIYPLVDFLMSNGRTKPVSGLTIKFDTLDAPEPWSDVYADSSRELFFGLQFGHAQLTNGKNANLIERARAFVYQGRLWFYAGPRTILQGWSLLK